MNTAAPQTGAATATDQPVTQLDHYRLLGRSGLRVSPLCLGTMTFGTAWGWGADAQTSKQIFDAYAQRGGNFIDTADFYTNGESESILRDLIAPDRDRYVLATKYSLNTKRGDPNAGGNQRKNMMRSVEASLQRLGTDYIDLYWLHVWDFTTPADEVMRALDDLVRAGKVLYIGISDAPAWKVAQLNTYAELMGWSRFVGLQIAYSLTNRGAERDLMPMARELGLGVTPWSPLDSGILTGKYTKDDLKREQELINSGKAQPFNNDQRIVGLTEQKLQVADAVKQVADEIGKSPAQVALNWLMTRPGVTSPILGARKMHQLEDNLAAIDFTLDDAHLDRLNQASAIDLGFPHDFIQGPFVREIVTGGAHIETPTNAYAG